MSLCPQAKALNVPSHSAELSTGTKQTFFSVWFELGFFSTDWTTFSWYYSTAPFCHSSQWHQIHTVKRDQQSILKRKWGWQRPGTVCVLWRAPRVAVRPNICSAKAFGLTMEQKGKIWLAAICIKNVCLKGKKRCTTCIQTHFFQEGSWPCFPW